MARMRCVIVFMVVVLALLTRPAFADDEFKIPGLEMDERSAELIRAWHKKVYNLGRDGVDFAACRLWIEGKAAPKHRFLEGTFRLENPDRKYDFTRSEGDGAFEGGWWRAEFENLLVGTGRLTFLPNCKLVAREKADGATDVLVFGYSPYEKLHFGKDGVLTGISGRAPSGGPEPVPVQISLQYDRWNDLYLLRSYTMTGDVPGQGRLTESGVLKWVRVLGRAVPVRVDLEFRQAQHHLTLTLWFRGWRFNSEIGPELDGTGEQALQRYEQATLNLGKTRHHFGSCRVTIRRGDEVAGATYAFDRKGSRKTYDEGSDSGVARDTEWDTWLDNHCSRYWLRQWLSTSMCKAERKGRTTILRCEDPMGGLFGPELETYVFGADGILTEQRAGDGDKDWFVRRYTYETEGGVARPVRMTLTLDADTTITSEMTYRTIEGVPMPRTLTVRLPKDEMVVVEFKVWNLQREPLELR